MTHKTIKLKISCISAMSMALLATASAAPLVPVIWKQSNSYNNLRLASNLSNATGMNAGETILYNQDGSTAGETTSADNKEWMTSSKSPTVTTRAAAMTAGKVWIVADLGASYNLSSIRVWNFNWDNTAGTPATSLNDRGVSQFDILVRNADADTANGTTGGTAINLDHPNDDTTNALDNSAVFALGTTNPWTMALENQSLTQAPNDDTYTGQLFSLTGQTARFIAIRVDSHYGNTGGIGLGKVRIESAGGVDTTPPTLLTITPPDDAMDVVTSSNLVANFSELIQVGTGAITLKRASDDSVVETFDVASPQLTWAATRVTIDPTDALTPGVAYYVQIASTVVKDPAGNFYAGIVDPDKTTWSFTADGTPPTVISVSPASPTKADPGTRLLAQFSEAVQVGSGTITIRKSSDDSIIETIDVTTPGAVVVNGRVVAIVRTTPLSVGTEYYVNVSAGAFRDPSSNPAAAISGTAAWKFTTQTAVPIIVENFSGASTSLHATSADAFAAAITTAGGISTWGAGSAFLGNGAVNGLNNAGAFLNLGSYINNTKGTAAGKFDLTLTIAEATGSWVSLGFVTGNAPSLSQNFTTMNGLGTIIYRSQSGTAAPNVNGELDMFGGPNNTNVVDGPDSNTGFRTLTVTLDLTPAGGYDGTSNFGKVTWSDSVLDVLGSYTYTTSRNFDSILITQGTTTSTINALALYQTIPINTFASWIGGFNVGTFTGVNDDFDGDGIGNAAENLLGSSPDVFSPGLMAASLSDGNLLFQHTRSTTPATDLTGTYEWSSDLISWHASGVTADGTTVTFTPPELSAVGPPELVEVTALITGTTGRVFVRFKATKN
jgi:hypothetical protein